ncbi:MAG: HupE/UreJ family protein [Proteobacteria bacterium]|nr:HupE/UreJ family protein [Pseudomonadota bacterium]
MVIAPLYAHGVDSSSKQFLLNNDGVALIPFIYIGAKHMITGYDHLLFLLGVIFFLYKSKDIIIYVSLFTLGHSITLIFGAFNDIQVNPYIIDAIIGFSIIYKGFDNLGGFKKLLGKQPNTKVAVLIFGLFHGFGLATKLQELELKENGLLQNLLAFNLGVELGQLIALSFVLILLSFWRKFDSYMKFSGLTNAVLMGAGMLLVMYQLTGYYVSQQIIS